MVEASVSGSIDRLRAESDQRLDGLTPEHDDFDRAGASERAARPARRGAAERQRVVVAACRDEDAPPEFGVYARRAVQRPRNGRRGTADFPRDVCNRDAHGFAIVSYGAVAVNGGGTRASGAFKLRLRKGVKLG